MKKIVFLTTFISPFQLEFSREINSQKDITYKTIFTRTENSQRGKHWKKNIDSFDKNIFSILKKKSIIGKAVEIYKILKENEPNYILMGHIRGIIPITSFLYSLTNNCELIFWLEKPLPSKNKIIKLLKHFEYRIYTSIAKKIFAIGNGAYEYYSKFNKNTFIIPYSQNLKMLINEEKQENDITTILFSGQLIKRHNIELIVNSLYQLFKTIGPKFKVIISGYGPEEIHLNNIKIAQFKDLFVFDRDFNEWEERLRPFKKADIFLYPSNYSGWGLVIPEALAHGLYIISTKQVEACKYFIDQNNGILIEPNINEITIALKDAITNKKNFKTDLIKKSSEKGDVSFVANTFIKSINSNV